MAAEPDVREKDDVANGVAEVCLGCDRRDVLRLDGYLRGYDPDCAHRDVLRLDGCLRDCDPDCVRRGVLRLSGCRRDAVVLRVQARKTLAFRDRLLTMGYGGRMPLLAGLPVCRT